MPYFFMIWRLGEVFEVVVGIASNEDLDGDD